jgi:hypothetical protein
MSQYTEDALYMGGCGFISLNTDQPNLNDIFGLPSTYSGTTSFNQRNKNYLVKIDDDFKIVSDNSLNETKLKKIIKVYYPDSLIEIFKLSSHADILLSTLIEPTSFLSSNEIDPVEFVSKLNMFDTIINYLNTLDKTNNFINKITTFAKSFERKEHLAADITRDFDVRDSQLSTRMPVVNANHYDIRGTGEFLSPKVKNSAGYKEHSLLSIPKNSSHFNVDGRYNDMSDVDVISGYNFSDTPFMEINKFSETLLGNYVAYNVYFNSQFNRIISTQDIGDFIAHNAKFKNLFPELQLVISEKIDATQLNQIKNLNNDIFVNLEDAKSRVNKILNDKIIDSKLSIDEIKELIKKYFDIDTDPEHCIKFTNIWNIISSEIKVSESYINYIKRQLPGILVDLGLDKKRLSDGIYWYGLVKKQIETPKNSIGVNLFTQINDVPVAEDAYQKLLVDRENMFNLVKSFADDDFLTSIDKSKFIDITKADSMSYENCNELFFEGEVTAQINDDTTPSETTLDKTSPQTPTEQSLANSSNIKKITKGGKKTTHIAQTPSDEIKKIIKKNNKNC